MIPPRILVACEWSDKDDFSQASKSERVLSNGATCGLIGEMVVAMQWPLIYCSRGEGSDDIILMMWR